MKKISLKGISEILSSKELKNVTGGSEWSQPGGPGGGDTHCLPQDWVCWVEGGSQPHPCCTGSCRRVTVELIPQPGGGTANLTGLRCA